MLLPGQKVQAQVFKKRGSGRGGAPAGGHRTLSDGEEKQNVFPLCTLHGCTYQTMRHEEELRLKERQVKRLLENAGICVQSWEGIVPVPSETGYHNKWNFSFWRRVKGFGDLALGMRKRMSYYEL